MKYSKLALKARQFPRLAHMQCLMADKSYDLSTRLSDFKFQFTLLFLQLPPTLFEVTRKWQLCSNYLAARLANSQVNAWWQGLLS